MKNLLLMAILALAGVVMAQQPAEPAENEQAMVRVAHLAPEAPNIDISVDGEPVFEGLAFRDVSDYQGVPSGNVEIALMVEGEEAVSGPHDLEAGRHYTLVVLRGEAEAPEEAAEPEEPEEAEEPAEPEEEEEPEEAVQEDLQVFLFEDEVTTPPEDEQALARVLHANADVGDVDVVVEEQEVVTGLGFTQVSAYFALPTEAALEIRGVETGEAVTEVGAGELEQGTIYTVFITQDEAGEPDVIIQEDDIMVEEDDMEPEDDEDAEDEEDGD